MLLQHEIFPGIPGRGINGHRGIRLLRCDEGEEAEFMT
jgi:hypothetical protein